MLIFLTTILLASYSDDASLRNERTSIYTIIIYRGRDGCIKTNSKPGKYTRRSER